WQSASLPATLLDLVSPGTAAVYEEFLPTQPEVLPDGKTAAGAATAGTTLSLYREGTQQYSFRLLALLLFFAVIRSNLNSSAAFAQLAFVAALNGTLLCLFGLIQYFTSPRELLYWSVPSIGQVFGPFVSRNQFAFYVNLCIGLALGLVLAQRY